MLPSGAIPGHKCKQQQVGIWSEDKSPRRKIYTHMPSRAKEERAKEPRKKEGGKTFGLVFKFIWESRQTF
jgi:hypothetical protein